MKCPACSADLLLSERQGIEIDYCPACRGVWLDRGELDQLLNHPDHARVSIIRSIAKRSLIMGTATMITIIISIRKQGEERGGEDHWDFLVNCLIEPIDSIYILRGAGAVTLDGHRHPEIIINQSFQ
jgi:hypothetical protein